MAEGSGNGRAAFPAPLAAYRAEVLRWNSQINLVSRRDPARRLDALIDQCDRAFSALVAAYRQTIAGSVLYCDLGAGGGLPGFIWHERLLRESVRVTSWLVEPREKRAWFLERVARLGGPPAYGVLQGRWGAVAAATAEPADTVLISLKALRLTDAEVLEGLATLRQGWGTLSGRVVIARFQPPATVWTADLATALGWAGAGQPLGPWRGADAAVLPVGGPGRGDAALAVCSYAAGAA